MVRRRVLALGALMLMAACSQAPSAPATPDAPAIRVQGVTLSPSAQGRDMSAGFLTIENSGARADRLVSVESPIATRIEFHETRMGANDVMEMYPISGGVPVPAEGEVVFQSGGLHLMLLGLKAPLIEGDHAQMTFTFETSGPIQVDAVVARPTGQAPATSMSMHDMH